MEQDISMLNSIRKATQMGCYGIQSVLDETDDREIRKELNSEYREYSLIFNQADMLLQERSSKGKNVHPLAKMGSAMSSKMRVRASRDPVSKIAELMVQGNTRGMIKSMHNIRNMGVLDPKVSSLANRLLQSEQANIDSMKQFL